MFTPESAAPGSSPRVKQPQGLASSHFRILNTLLPNVLLITTFIHQLATNTYLLGSYSMTGMFFLGAGDMQVNKTDEVPSLVELTLSKGREKDNKQTN